MKYPSFSPFCQTAPRGHPHPLSVLFLVVSFFEYFEPLFSTNIEELEHNYMSRNTTIFLVNNSVPWIVRINCAALESIHPLGNWITAS